MEQYFTPNYNILGSLQKVCLHFQEQLARERVVSGRVQIQVWYHDERKELVIAVLAADELAARDDSFGFGSLPEAYARLCLMPLT